MKILSGIKQKPNISIGILLLVVGAILVTPLILQEMVTEETEFTTQAIAIEPIPVHEVLTRDDIITGVVGVYWDEPSLNIEPLAIASTGTITVDVHLKLELIRQDYPATYTQEIIFRDIMNSLGEDYSNLSGQFNGEWYWGWHGVPLAGNFQENICMEWVVNSTAPLEVAGTSLLTNTATFSSTFINNGIVAPIAHDCHFVNRQIEFLNKIYLPLVFKNM